jgi:hypothetical protein
MKMIDIPQGYLYGFPMEYDRDNETETFVEWCIRKGVPEDIADDIAWVRTWTEGELIQENEQ